MAAEDLFNCVQQALGATNIEETVTIENFATFLEWIGPLQKGAGFLDQLIDLFRKPYFHGNISVSEADKVLMKTKKGTYLVKVLP